MSGGRFLERAFVTAFLLFLFLPLAIVLLFSLHSSPRLGFPFEGFSTRWYRDVLSDPLIREAGRRTCVAALSTGLLAGVLGMTAALGMTALRDRSRAALLFAAMIPLAFPALLYAIGLAILYRQLGVDYSLMATIGGHVVIAMPFVFLVIGAALDQFRFTLLEAARDLGATGFEAFRTVTLPIILPAVLGAVLLSMALSTDEFVIAFFTAGQEKTLPLVLYSRMNRGLDPSLNAIGGLLLAATTALALIAARRTSKEVTE